MYSVKTAVVILNYNGSKFLKQFLPSVIQHSSDAKISVADNCSTDDSVEVLKSEFPSVELIQNTENGGFAKGYNDALKKVDAEYYLLLNSDIEVTENWLTPLVEFLDRNTNVAACQPKVQSFYKKGFFEHAGASGGFIDKDYFPYCRGRIFDTAEEDKGQYDDEIPVFWVTGACMLIRSKVFHEVNGFDERFFAHMEEIDLCWRIHQIGYECWVVPKSLIYHVGGGTLNYMSPRKTFLNFRNNLLMIHKNHKGWLFPKVFRRLIIDGIAGVLFLLKGQFPHTLAVLKAHFSYYALIFSVHKDRVRLKQIDLKKSHGFLNKSLLIAYFIKKIKIFSDLN